MQRLRYIITNFEVILVLKSINTTVMLQAIFNIADVLNWSSLSLRLNVSSSEFFDTCQKIAWNLPTNIKLLSFE